MTEETLVPLNPVDLEIERPLNVIKGHVCGICQKLFKRIYDLRKHASVHFSEKLIPCDHCDLKFASDEALHQHRKYVSLKKVHQCEVCQKSFKMLCILKLHLKTHTEERPFKCEMCDKSFRRKSSLKYHYGSQTNLAHHRQFEKFKQFEYLVEKYKNAVDNAGVHACTVCSKQFKSLLSLQRHVLIHDEFECDICGQKFNKRSNFLCHKRSMHNPSNKEFYSCKICKMSFGSKYSAELHETAIHEQGRTFKCGICPLVFLDKSLLDSHMSTHQNERKNTIGEKSYACTMCDRKYTTFYYLKYHMREHTGEKPYVCDVCNNSFKGYEVLKNHSKWCKAVETTVETKQNADS